MSGHSGWDVAVSLPGNHSAQQAGLWLSDLQSLSPTGPRIRARKDLEQGRKIQGSYQPVIESNCNFQRHRPMRKLFVFSSPMGTETGMYKNVFTFSSSWCAYASQLKNKKPAEDMIDEPLTVWGDSSDCLQRVPPRFCHRSIQWLHVHCQRGTTASLAFASEKVKKQQFSNSALGWDCLWNTQKKQDMNFKF